MAMTEYTDRVENRRLELAADTWGKGIKHLHYNNGIEEVKFQNGDIQYTDIANEEVWWEYAEEPKSLVDKYLRWKTDRRHG
jgi:hypothetical protein